MDWKMNQDNRIGCVIHNSIIINIYVFYDILESFSVAFVRIQNQHVPPLKMSELSIWIWSFFHAELNQKMMELFVHTKF